MTTYCLFEGRHDLPSNQGAIFSSFDFSTFTGVKTPLYKELMNNGGKLLVTGLTPALTSFLAQWTTRWYCPNHLIAHEANMSSDVIIPTLVLLHFDNSSKTYVEQYF
jgi:hypothetical protein